MALHLPVRVVVRRLALVAPLACGAAPGPSGDLADTSTDTSGTITGDADESSTDAPAGCGDGVVDVEELCDDGNDADGDGCNVDCRPSGMVAWTVEVLPALPGTLDEPAVTLAGDRIALVDHRSFESGGSFIHQTHVRIYDDEGTEHWGDAHPTQPDDHAPGPGTGLPDGSIAIAYRPDGGSSSRLRKYTPDGAIEWEVDPDPALYVGTLSAQPAGMIGHACSFDDCLLVGLDLDGEERWRAPIPVSPHYVDVLANAEGGLAMLNAGATLLAFDGQGAALGQWSFSSESILFLGPAPAGYGYWASMASVDGHALTRHGADADEQLSIAMNEPPGAAAGMPDGGVVVAVTPVEDGLVHLLRLDPDGAGRWDTKLTLIDGGSLVTVWGIAVAPDGFVWVVGSDYADGASRLWLSGVTP